MAALATPQQPGGEDEEAMLREQHLAELAGLSRQLAALKAPFYKRQIARRKLGSARQAMELLGPPCDPHNPTAVAALRELQALVAAELLHAGTTLPLAADALHKKLLAGAKAAAYRASMRTLHHPDLARALQSLAAVDGRRLVDSQLLDLNGSRLLVITAVHRAALAKHTGVADLLAGAAQAGSQAGLAGAGAGGKADPQAQVTGAPEAGDQQAAKRHKPGGTSSDLDQLLQFRSLKERDRQEKGEELLELLDRKTARQQAKHEVYQTGGQAVREFCPHLTKDECRRARGAAHACDKLHQRKVVHPWTDESKGNCPYLGGCRNPDNSRCRFVHYVLDPDPDQPGGKGGGVVGTKQPVPAYLQALPEPQWIRCDIRELDLGILGKFGVIMTDPPWEIHQELPYGTMSDAEMLAMPIEQLQDDGVIFMWVTTRALELGREMLARWGYTRTDELIWVKTNSLQRLIRSGRTGHWLNHTKEHCLVGLKGNPAINRYVDCDVLVAEPRETSRKPDEMYPLLERLSPGTRKLEIFARKSNVRPGWVSLGNQLDGIHLTDPELLARYRARYGEPERPRHPPSRRAAISFDADQWG